MSGIERLQSIELSTVPLARALPELPQAETVLIRLIRVGAFGLDDYFSEVFRKQGLTEKSYHVLCLLVASKKGKASPSELSEMIGTSRANMTKVITTLEASGLVKREIGKTDGRRSQVTLTKRGRDTVNKVTPEVVSPVRNAFAKLSKEEMASLDKILRKLIVSFDVAKTQSHVLG